MQRFTLSLLLVLVGCASMPGDEVQKMPVQIVSAAPDAQTQVSEIIPVKQVLRPQDVLDVILHIDTTSKEPYRIQPGDQVDLSFFTAPEFSGTRLVMPDGTIHMPYIGAIQIAGLSAAQAQQQIATRYASVLKRPEIAFSISRPMAQLDALRTTLQHPASGMSREITIGLDGRASFPLIGSLSLQGLTIDELRDMLNQRYAEEVGQIRTDVLLKSTAPNQVFVLGEVVQPGAFPITRPISVPEALTLARGVNIGARLDSVVIMRRQGNQVEAHTYNAAQALNGKTAQFAYLQADDLLFVPKTFLAQTGELMRQLADVILFQGVNFGLSYRVDNKNRTD